MHILFCVFFNSHRGGLHENVFSTVLHSMKRGYRTTVVCKEGEFSERLLNEGSGVITTDFEDIEATIEKILTSSKEDFDVVHTHPGPSRKVAMGIADKLNIPILMTFHGMWKDSLPRYSNKLSAIFAVSEGVKDFLKSNLSSGYDKFMIMPNGVDTSLFKPKHTIFKRKNLNQKKINISLITRLDKDKNFILEIFYKALQFTCREYTKDVRWTIVGDGTELEEIKQNCDKITKGNQKVDFVGWKSGKALAKSYQESDIVIAPGRCALEAMASAKPVIAIGSKKYNGLVTKENWLNGVYTNFGGFGKKMDDYIEGSIENDLTKVLTDQNYRNDLGELGVFIVNEYYNAEEINDRIVSVYNIIK